MGIPGREGLWGGAGCALNAQGFWDCNFRSSHKQRSRRGQPCWFSWGQPSSGSGRHQVLFRFARKRTCIRCPGPWKAPSSPFIKLRWLGQTGDMRASGEQNWGWGCRSRRPESGVTDEERRRGGYRAPQPGRGFRVTQRDGHGEGRKRERELEGGAGGWVVRLGERGGSSLSEP